MERKRLTNRVVLTITNTPFGRDMAKYRKYMLEQAKELMTNYGKVDIIWSVMEDIEYAQFLHDASEITIDMPPASPYGDGRPAGGLLLPVLKPAVEAPVVEVFLK